MEHRWKATDRGRFKYSEEHSPSAPLSQYVLRLLFLLINGNL